MDFLIIREVMVKGVIEIVPDFGVLPSKDLMIRGNSFYAIWDEQKGLWSTNEYDCQRLIDDELSKYADNVRKRSPQSGVYVRYLKNFSSTSWTKFKNYISSAPDNSHQLDETLTFANTPVTKKNYVSKRLNYSLTQSETPAYSEIMSTLYSDEERKKLEWAVGSIISGDSRFIQKFIVLYGDPGTGKSTFIKIIEKLFKGYYTSFDASALTSKSNAFATEMFKDDPLVGIQHDGDLSRIEDLTKLNSIVSHEDMLMNVKYKSGYTARVNCFLFIGTNKPVKITDAKAGILRRLIDVTPTGNTISNARYNELMSQIDFELGGIAQHCLDVYKSMGKAFYNNYRPMQMIFKTDVFFNFVEANYYTFADGDGISLTQAYDIYKNYCDESCVDFKLPRHKFREELKNYFEKFEEVTRINGRQIRSYYSGFITSKFQTQNESNVKTVDSWLKLDKRESLLDEMLKDCPAQYANDHGAPILKWAHNNVVLKDLDTTKLHYVKMDSPNHIVIDFDLKDESGNKSRERNLEAASKWPKTYAEYSKSGSGIHLHYIYDGDVNELSKLYAIDIEVKIYSGDSALRRQLSKCNDLPIAHISAGLPKKEKKMINKSNVENEQHLRNLIFKSLNKEIHPDTTSSIHFIKKILDDMYESGIPYDISDLRPSIYWFASNSTHQKEHCIDIFNSMFFKSEVEPEPNNKYTDEELIFFDCESYPNLFVVCWIPDHASKCVRMINPSPKDIADLFEYKLVGFNNLKYDNIMLYARYLGYSVSELHGLSQRIIDGSRNVYSGEAKNVSFTDIFDFCAKKQSLKKWEIELKQHHLEMGIPWDKPVPKELWDKVAEYCENDVLATRAVFHANQADFKARCMLADASGLTENNTTNQHTTAIIFGKEKKPQNVFHYRDLSKPVHEIDPDMYDRIKQNTIYPIETPFLPYTCSDLPWNPEEGESSILPYFPGYKHEFGKSTYRGEEVGEGGFVYAEPGVHLNVKTFDIASMHPSSMELEDLFGKYTANLSMLKKLRIYIKHKEYDKAKEMFNGKFTKYLTSDDDAKALSYALKIAINSVYGLTAAKFDNAFKDPRNKDNIVAKRGALFMVDLKNAVQEKGFTVAHIKTDSIKIPNPTPEIEQFIMDFGKRYGYTFEIESVYRKMCLVNDAVYIAQEEDGNWTATGAEFAHPVIFKTLFSHEPLTFDDFCETKSVTSSLYLDFNENLEDVSSAEQELAKREKLIKNPEKRIRLNPEFESYSDEELKILISKGHDYRFVGRVGQFTPIKPGCGGGLLMREKDGKYYAVNGSKGYRWMESEIVRGVKEPDIDMDYYNNLVESAKASISKFCDFEEFINI